MKLKLNSAYIILTICTLTVPVNAKIHPRNYEDVDISSHTKNNCNKKVARSINKFYSTPINREENQSYNSIFGKNTSQFLQPFEKQANLFVKNTYGKYGINDIGDKNDLIIKHLSAYFNQIQNNPSQSKVLKKLIQNFLNLRNNFDKHSSTYFSNVCDPLTNLIKNFPSLYGIGHSYDIKPNGDIYLMEYENKPIKMSFMPLIKECKLLPSDKSLPSSNAIANYVKKLFQIKSEKLLISFKKL